MSTSTTLREKPDVQKGVHYWRGVPATVDGVLGGYGKGTLPVVDAQGSRTFLLEMLPRLGAVPPATVHADRADAAAASSSSSNAAAVPKSKKAKGDSVDQPPRNFWLEERIAQRGGPGRAKSIALDCGAGVGRVTRDVLLRLVDIVHIVEPVDSFLRAAKEQSSAWPSIRKPPSKTPLQARKAVHFHLSTLQTFDPARPYSSSSNADEFSRKSKPSHPPTLSVADNDDDNASQGAQEAISRDEPVLYDVVWGQWCLQHLSDEDLVAFLQRAKACLRPPSNDIAATSDADQTAVLDGAGIIVVKENVLRESEDGSERVWYDEEDHSITRTPNAYERVFRQAGLQVVKTQLQLGLPQELLPVQMWCLRIPRQAAANIAATK